jgi:hypothetical protein
MSQIINPLIKLEIEKSTKLFPELIKLLSTQDYASRNERMREQIDFKKKEREKTVEI